MACGTAIAARCCSPPRSNCRRPSTAPALARVAPIGPASPPVRWARSTASLTLFPLARAISLSCLKRTACSSAVLRAMPARSAALTAMRRRRRGSTCRLSWANMGRWRRKPDERKRHERAANTNAGQNRHMRKIICVGHSALDRVFTVEAWPQASAKVRAHSLTEVGGGMAANAAAVARLGGDVAFWGPVGGDSVADVMRAQLQAAGVDVSGLRRFAGLTSSASAILIDARGERLIVSYRGSALEAPADWLPLDQVAFAGALLADVRWPQGAAAALRAARRARIPSVLDADTAEAAT